MAPLMPRVVAEVATIRRQAMNVSAPCAFRIGQRVERARMFRVEPRRSAADSMSWARAPPALGRPSTGDSTELSDIWTTPLLYRRPLL